MTEDRTKSLYRNLLEDHTENSGVGMPVVDAEFHDSEDSAIDDDDTAADDTRMLTLPKSGFNLPFETEVLLHTFMTQAEDVYIQIFRDNRDNQEFVEFLLRAVLEGTFDQLREYLAAGYRPVDPIVLPDFAKSWEQYITSADES